MVNAAITLKSVDFAMGVERVALIRAAVTVSTKSKIALATGIAISRVPAACAAAFDLLDEWRMLRGGR